MGFRVRLLSGCVGLCVWVAAASAQSPPELPFQTEPSDRPVVLTADQITYDEQLNVVIAAGNVEISQEARVLRADRVIYNQRTDVVTATGNVILTEADGNVTFAEFAELEGDLANGFVQQVGLLLADNSRLAASSGLRFDNGRTTVVDRAVYSACDLCPTDPERPLVWQIRAVRATHDNEALDVEYRDAFLDFLGVPILYTPYLSHPDPRVERRSGFLAPLIGSTDRLGPFVIPAYYWAIGPDQDATFRLGATANAGVIGRAEYRRRFENSRFAFDGSVNQSEVAEDFGRPTERREENLRGHLFADGRIDINEHWRAIGRLELVSDPTYLDSFRISDEDVLESRGVLEGFYGLSYVAAETLGFRDLRLNALEQPLIAPQLTGSYVGEPGEVMGGQLFADANGLNLLRSDGISTRRFSLSGGWRRDYFTDAGVVTSLTGSLRGDVYASDDLPDPDDPTVLRDGVTAGRLVPAFDAVARYPLVRQAGTWQQLIEPVAAFTAIGDFGNTDDIPNNDSLGVELDEINLFSPNRYPGLDRVEDGLRFTYGLRLGLFAPSGSSATFFLGQSYRFVGGDDALPRSGFEDDASDVVGRLNLSLTQYFGLDWRFRFDPESFDSRRHEVTGFAGVPQLLVSTTYTFGDTLSERAVVGTNASSQSAFETEEVVLGVSSRLSQYWTAVGSWRRNINEGENRDIAAGLIYNDECFTFGVRYIRDFTVNRERDEGTAVFVTIAFRNLGEPLAFGGPSTLF